MLTEDAKRLKEEAAKAAEQKKADKGAKDEGKGNAEKK